MAHAAGLPPFRRFFLTLAGRDAIVAASAREELANEPGTKTVYSDLGAILLMACAESAGGKPFPDLVRERVLRPLGMGARFARTGEPIAAAPTEDCPWRKGIVRGEVHDENAFAMGGVSGHAGLFGTARDVAKLGNAFLGGGRGWLAGPLARAATRRAGIVAGSSRALLFDTFVPGGPAGSLLSPRAFGHTGFTGTSLWCDPATDVCIVLLSNRVHPSRENAKIQEVRRRVHDLVAASIAGARVFLGGREVVGPPR
jgi:CubicO group peptidase (beta-lactamase class C family)